MKHKPDTVQKARGMRPAAAHPDAEDRVSVFEAGRLKGKRELAEIFLLGRYWPPSNGARAAKLQRAISLSQKLNASQLDAFIAMQSKVLNLDDVYEWLREEDRSPDCQALNVKEVLSSLRWEKMNS